MVDTGAGGRGLLIHTTTVQLAMEELEVVATPGPPLTVVDLVGLAMVAVEVVATLVPPRTVPPGPLVATLEVEVVATPVRPPMVAARGQAMVALEVAATPAPPRTAVVLVPPVVEPRPSTAARAAEATAGPALATAPWLLRPRTPSPKALTLLTDPCPGLLTRTEEGEII